jgi:membrane-bound lytic murein transglycosylase D
MFINKYNMLNFKRLCLTVTITISLTTLFSQTETVTDPIPVSDSAQEFGFFQKPKINNNDLITDSPIVAALDSVANIKFFQDFYLNLDPTLLNVFRFPVDFVPTYPDSVYIDRIKKLDAQTPIDLTFNQHVKDFINLYAFRKRNLTSRVLGLSYIYFPLYEEMLDKYDMPLELKYLSVIESALNPVAGSPVGAKGLWQFMYGTGKVYGLTATSYIDDRFDPYMATDAACRHMKDLYDIYGDWFLVLAAYNSGAGNVNKAIRRAGGTKNYWAIWPFLPKETRGYVPAFIAVTYVMNYSKEHNLYPLNPGILYNGIDTVIVKQPVSFEQINEKLGISMDELKFLNPLFKLGVIPSTPEKQYFLRLPREYIGLFINNEVALYNYKTSKGIEKEKLLEQIKLAKEQVVHIVKKGETLASIAKKYNVTTGDIKRWNNLKKNYVNRKKHLTIYPGSKSDRSTTPANEKAETPEKKRNQENSTKEETTYHVVASGETLLKISKQYGCSIDDLKKWNNLSGSTINVKQKLLVKESTGISESVQKQDTTVVKSSKRNKTRMYTVKDGDTLWEIAEKFDGVTVDQIKKLNKMKSTSLRAGQKIKIPATN